MLGGAADNPYPVELRSYDAFNRLTGVQSDSVIAAYTYRPDGLHLSKATDTQKIGPTGIKYTVSQKAANVWDGGNIYLELDGSGNITSRYVRGINLIKGVEGQNERFYLHNAHGDVVQLVNPQGTVSKNYYYDAFGVEINPDPNDGNVWRYCSDYWDKETESYYLRARYYNPTTGRFLSADTHWNTGNMLYGDDPLQLNAYTYAPNIQAIRQSANLYVYCISNPLFFVDPLGLDARGTQKAKEAIARGQQINREAWDNIDAAFKEWCQANAEKELQQQIARAEESANRFGITPDHPLYDEFLRHGVSGQQAAWGSISIGGVGVAGTASLIRGVQKVDGKYFAPKNVIDEIGKIEAKGVDFSKLTSNVTQIRNSTEGGVSRVVRYSDNIGTKFVIHEVTDKAGNVIHRDFDTVRIYSGQIINKSNR